MNICAQPRLKCSKHPLHTLASLLMIRNFDKRVFYSFHAFKVCTFTLVIYPALSNCRATSMTSLSFFPNLFSPPHRPRPHTPASV